LILGPTAPGKSAYALAMARRHDGENINANSIQVHANLQILTGQSQKDEISDIPHHMFSFMDADVHYQTRIWPDEAIAAKLIQSG
jgi:tRNA dimethylallyltransferase